MALPNPLTSGFGCELGIWGEKEIWVEKEISGHPQAAWCVPSSHSSWAVVVTLPSAWSKVATKGISTTPHPLATHPPFLMAESMSLGAVWEHRLGAGWEHRLGAESLCPWHPRPGGHARNPCHEVQQVFPVPRLLRLALHGSGCPEQLPALPALPDGFGSCMTSVAARTSCALSSLPK